MLPKSGPQAMQEEHQVQGDLGDVVLRVPYRRLVDGDREISTQVGGRNGLVVVKGMTAQETGPSDLPPNEVIESSRLVLPQGVQLLDHDQDQLQAQLGRRGVALSHPCHQPMHITRESLLRAGQPIRRKGVAELCPPGGGQRSILNQGVGLRGQLVL